MQTVTYNNYCLKRKEFMMTEELPSSFNVVVIGSGLEESVLAAAAARNGHTVLHVDNNDYYGQDWAAFTFQGLNVFIDKQKVEEEKSSDSLLEEVKQLKDLNLANDKEVFVPLTTSKKHTAIKNIKQEWFVPEINEPEGDIGFECAPPRRGESHGDMDNRPVVETRDMSTQADETSRKNWTQSVIRASSRFFNIDLNPKLLFARGSMVELLISSSISRYTEFKTVTRVLTLMTDGTLEHVPSSRSDIFSTKHISVVEKRMLMKFLTFCATYDQEEVVLEDPFEGRSFKEYLKHEKLTDNLIHFIAHSIAMVDGKVPCAEGLKATQKFLQSLGRFGNTPFLWSMYGSGELPQAFCRLCAVFGGTYYLGRNIDGLVFDADNTKCMAVITDGKRIECDKLVVSGLLLPDKLKKIDKKYDIKRDIFLTKDSILPADKEQISFVSLPPDNESGSFTFVQEVGFGAAACPHEMYTLQVSRIESKEEETNFEKFKTAAELEEKQLFHLSFDMETEEQQSDRVVDNLYVCSGPLFEIDYDMSIANCRRQFENMFPGEEFLPRAPEPEEIIIGEQEEKKSEPEQVDANKDN